MAGSFKKFAFVILAVSALGLTACETPPPVQKLPELTFAHLGPLNLNVARIDVVSYYRPPLQAPNVEHLFPTPPLKAVRRWAGDRLKAVGKSGTAKLIIRKASAVETPLEMKKGLKAAFTKQQSYRYDLDLEATLELPGGGRATARSTRFTTVREDASINERNRIWLDLTENLIRDFDREMKKNLSRFLVR
jgi:hypothetical protein